MRVVDKDISSQKKKSGQFLTPREIVDFCLGKVELNCINAIEPSCGKGVFLDAVRAKSPNCKVLGIELDKELAKEYTGTEAVRLQNFYDFNEQISGSVAFVGNPPYRTPAVSLTSHNNYIKQLMGTYGVSGVKEEAVFFIVKTVDLIIKNKVNGEIHYILPKSIFQNNSTGYKTFVAFLKKYVQLLQVWDIAEFPDVDQKLVFVSMRVLNEDDKIETSFMMNGQDTPVDEFYGNSTEYIPFQKIFKKTHLGSVPCESLFLSIDGETAKQFRDRLSKLFDPDTVVNADTVVDLLSHGGKQHIRSIRKGNNAKVDKMLVYIDQTKHLDGYSPDLFKDLGNYKPIKHRCETRFYFRHEFLKKAPFIYIINSNPCPSFYFPGNPSANSTDYFGFCTYDVNRNSGPGANRCVPTTGLEENLHPTFKRYWNDNTGCRPYSDIFMYIIYISQSEWYKKLKKTYHRFYFGLPKKFDLKFLELPCV